MSAQGALSTFWALLISLVFSNTVLASSGIIPETEIRILPIYDGSGSADITAIANLLSDIETAWNDSNLTTAATVRY